MREPTPHDIGPDDTMDLAGEALAPNSDVELAMTVPFTAAQLAALERIARERGISVVEAVQRLVEEGLESRAHRSAA